jgi:Asp/Glu/hydantoin racemase
MTRIALIHAVPAAMQPVEDAFKAHWREARRTNLLDDSLAGDREQAGQLTPGLSGRIVALARYAVDSGADGVLFTCSAFGEAIEAASAALPAPVLKPNEAMFEAALQIGGRIGMLATFAPAVASMEDEFASMARHRGSAARLKTIVAPGAREALLAGELDRHNRLVAEAASDLAGCDAIMLAHFSMAGAAPRVSDRTGRPTLAAPETAVVKLRSLLTGPTARRESDATAP